VGLLLVDDEGGSGGAPVVGRDAELAMLDDAVARGSDSGAVIVVGGPGIGKTTLWDAAIGAARALRVRVWRRGRAGARRACRSQACHGARLRARRSPWRC
jgi:ABC-type branched-subunit amino acid transport system ATPase component